MSEQGSFESGFQNEDNKIVDYESFLTLLEEKRLSIPNFSSQDDEVIRGIFELLESQEPDRNNSLALPFQPYFYSFRPYFRIGNENDFTNRNSTLDILGLIYAKGFIIGFLDRHKQILSEENINLAALPINSQLNLLQNLFSTEMQKKDFFYESSSIGVTNGFMSIYRFIQNSQNLAYFKEHSKDLPQSIQLLLNRKRSQDDYLNRDFIKRYSSLVSAGDIYAPIYPNSESPNILQDSSKEILNELKNIDLQSLFSNIERSKINLPIEVKESLLRNFKNIMLSITDSGCVREGNNSFPLRINILNSHMREGGRPIDRKNYRLEINVSSLSYYDHKDLLYKFKDPDLSSYKNMIDCISTLIYLNNSMPLSESFDEISATVPIPKNDNFIDRYQAISYFIHMNGLKEVYKFLHSNIKLDSNLILKFPAHLQFFFNWVSGDTGADLNSKVKSFLSENDIFNLEKSLVEVLEGKTKEAKVRKPQWKWIRFSNTQ